MKASGIYCNHYALKG